MDISESVAMVTGAAQGLGAALVDELLLAGAKKVYAADIAPRPHADDRVVPLVVDIPSEAAVASAAAAAHDLQILVNNAGIATRTAIMSSDSSNLRREIETNCFGTLNMMRAFAPVLRRNGGGTILNVLSAQSWFANPLFATYGTAKSAEWAMTNAARLELWATGVRVSALHVGYMATTMTADLDVPKSDPEIVAQRAIAGIAQDAFEIVADARSASFKAKLSGPIEQMYPVLEQAPPGERDAP